MGVWCSFSALMILVKTAQKDRDSRSVLKEYCAMVDCLYDYVGRCQENSVQVLFSL